jgi:signal transduction histidine kinase
MVKLPKEESPNPFTAPASFAKLTLGSTLAALPLFQTQLDVTSLTKKVVHKFQQDGLIPGIILRKKGKFYGMISRRRFLERMSRPYALEIFLNRPLSTLYDIENFSADVLPAGTPIPEAAEYALRRNPERMYEPIVAVDETQNYSLVDVPHLLNAQSHIYQLTHQLLKEQTHAHMVQTEKMASLGRMVAGVAHEIRNPVNCVYGNMSFIKNYFADLLNLVQAYQSELVTPSPAIAALEEEVELDFLKDDLPKILQSVELSAGRMTEIVASLRNFSRIDENKQQLVNVPECIDSTLLILNNRFKKQRVEVQKDYEANLPEILGFAGQLSQVFINLIANALDALDEKQSRIIKQNTDGKTLSQPLICLKIFAEFSEKEDKTDWLCVQIIDNADGIPENVQQHIFDNFFTTKPLGKGTGLGLAISHEIITQKHRGKLKLDSTLGQGSTFTVRLPIMTIEAAEEWSA